MQKSKGTILYVGGFELPDRNAAAHRVLSNAKAFRELGYRVVFSGVDKTIKAAGTCFNVDGFECYPTVYPRGLKQMLKWYFDVSHYISLLEKCEDITCVIAYNPKGGHLNKLIKYCKKRNIKIVVDATEWYDRKFSISPEKLLKYIDTNWCMRSLYKKVDGMIAISRYLENYYYQSLKSVVTVPPLVDVNEEKWQPVEESCSCLKFVYSGDPVQKDELGRIVESFDSASKSKSFHFDVIGVNKAEFLKLYPELNNTIKHLEKSIAFHGRVSHRDSLNILKSADYCIFVREKSRNNMAGFPTKFVESYSAGLHIIANDVSDIREYFPKDSHSVLLPNCSIQNLNDTLEKVLSMDIIDMRNTNKRFDNPFDYRKWIDTFDTFFSALQI